MIDLDREVDGSDGQVVVEEVQNLLPNDSHSTNIGAFIDFLLRSIIDNSVLQLSHIIPS